MNRLIVLVLILAGCAAPEAEKKRPADDLIGRPPPPSEDPFYFVAMEKAVRVDTTGTVEPDPVEPDSVQPDPVDPNTEVTKTTDPPVSAVNLAEFESRERELRLREAELSRREAEVESKYAELAKREFEVEKRNESVRADLLARESGIASALEEVEALRREVEASRKAPPKAKYSGYQCMSCVSVCPIVDGRAVCQGEDDMVCGWGVHDSKETASKAAVAECRGALDLMESGSEYREIRGNCPAATCSP